MIDTLYLHWGWKEKATPLELLNLDLRGAALVIDSSGKILSGYLLNVKGAFWTIKDKTKPQI